MAIRIPVVISQNERRSGSIADYEEQLITRVVMESGLDATLIADLKSIELHTTDHLCIEGLKGDFALATWETSEYVCDHLHRLGVPSIEIIPVDGSPKSRSGDAGSRSIKKIFLVSLAINNSIDATIKTLKDLLEARSTPVFSLGAPIHRNIPIATILSPTVDRVQPSPMPRSVMPPPIRVNASTQLVSSVYPDSNFPNIDQLMDDLDQFEI